MTIDFAFDEDKISHVTPNRSLQTRHPNQLSILDAFLRSDLV
jgi:hypothetical protein